ncbi:MAG: CPBP family glutamic-type intramembrane protease, partial [Candidatus Thermoplasmatota archaeon]
HLFGGTLTRVSPRPLLLTAAILVPASSVVFGLAHVPAWGWWKFLPAMVAGLGMGYLFVRHGFLAGVMFHFATDYLGALAILSGDGLAAQILLGLFILVLFGFGAFFLVGYGFYAVRLHRHFAGTLPPEPPPAPAPVPVAGPVPTAVAAPPGAPPPVGTAAGPPYGYGWIAFACPRCGGREARYVAGRFTCLRCGHASP